MKKKRKEKKEIEKPIKKKGKINPKNIPSLQLKTENDIAMDFAVKVYKKFDRIIKSIILFGSNVKQNAVAGSDIDIVIIIDDASVKWDPELIVWYREELEKIIQASPYKKDLHINTVKLTTWWEDLIRGDPIVINILRYGQAMVDAAGFFNPLKYLLIAGKIKSTPEAIHSCLQRAPEHFARSKSAELASIEGLYWTMVDSSHAALMANNISPPSPEHLILELKENFVNTGKLKMKYVVWFRDLNFLHKKISHGEITDLKGVEIDDWQKRAEEFLNEMIRIVNETIKQQ
ncbi:MAG TPA: nucleotidyltransferase domain-containing protein [Candidatus Pacearchaeota archaeon]|nr:nucleotidyltransferase domain-containing protein [Candidatus Pacearchaeota archaeon]